MGPEKDCAPTNTMISTPPPSPPLPGSPRLRGCHVPCPAAPPCSPCPSPRLSPRNSSCPVGAPLYPPRSGHLGLPDPQRRHSWDPGAAVLGYLQYEDLSVSMGDLNPEEIEKLVGGALGRLTGRDPRRAPITNYAQDFGSLLSLTEEEVAPDPPRFSLLEEQSSQLQGCSASAPSLCDPLAESRSQSSATCPWPRPQPRTYSHYNETSLYSVVGGSTQSVDAGSELGSLDWGTEERTEGQQGGKEEREEKTGSPLGRTLSFLRKMAGTRKNKEKERMKEREKEAREREARYSNGHLFTSLTVSGTTLCSACNKSITAKEALSCPTCNVTIHNRCRDTLPNCVKMKQRQQKLALVRNSSALQNVALRTKSPMLKERPSSAIYPSDLRQSLLGARRPLRPLPLQERLHQ
ncbi:hypothetical protein ANANG_G00008300 [Anguilla anguilla]|uniref:Phorbol-ester/DAG-type domain-containing protein n=1 Tax=Anguilla anguilla TaxID=7936 RepID=A0A9D3MWP9_ANGAN|nr:hypothetical protein ANANG_G00008300 [Anguilla anguilla]